MFNQDTPLYSLTIGQFVELLRAETAKVEAPQELPKFLTPSQLSELIGLKLTTIYQNHHNGLIPGAKKVGNKLLFEAEKILAWIEENSIPTKEEKIKALTAKRRVK